MLISLILKFKKYIFEVKLVILKLKISEGFHKEVKIEEFPSYIILKKCEQR